MSLTQQDLANIKKSLQPEFDKVEKNIRTALQPEFDKVEQKLSGKLERLRKENRKDHNMIIASFDRADHKLGKRVNRIETYLKLPPLQ